MDSDVLIIGGGVLGTSLSYHLSKKGISSTLFEKEGSLAHHASGKNAGMIRQLYRHPQLTEWAKRSITSWPLSLKSLVFKETGSIVLGRNMPAHHKELFSSGEIHTQEKCTPYVYCKTDGLLDSSGYVQGLKDLANSNYSHFHFGAMVQEISKNSDSWKLRTENGATFEGKWLVNAAGAWVNQIMNPALSRHRISVEAFARFLFLSKGWQEKPPAPHAYGFYWDEKNEWYMRDWSEDCSLISACDTIPADPETYTPDSNIEHSISSRILKAIPDLASNLTLGRGWHCFRTYTDDMLPVWGEDELLPGLFWLAGFGGFGMSTSFGATEDAASYIAGEKVSCCHDFNPSRVKKYEPITRDALISNV
jgi:D-arginine dehydrogenase